MTTKKLPSQPSLDQLRKQAKDLIRSFRAGDQASQERIVAQVKAVAGDLEKGKSQPSLSFAQLTVAREYGFESWPKLKFFVESLGMTFEQKLDAFVQAATSNRLYYAKYLLQNEPKLASHDLSTACVVGDVSLVEKILRQTPALVNVKTGVKNWEPILYVGFSFFSKDGKESEARLLRVAEVLVAYGANVNAFFLHRAGDLSPTNQVPVLYGPCGTTGFAELAEFLLKAGANADERESLYHSTEFSDKSCMRLLLEHGANPTKWGALHRQLDNEDYPGVEILLTAGADPNFQYEGLGTALHHAIARGRGTQIIELLLKHGAKTDMPGPDGRTPYKTALRYGNSGAVQILAQKTVHEELSVEENFIAACASTHEKAARELLARNPNLMQRLPESDLKLIADFAALGKTAAVKLMLELGFALNQRGEWAGSVLHQAAWHGHLELVEFLVSQGADLEAKNAYGGTALAAIVFQSSFQEVKVPEVRCIEIAESLLEAGAALLPYLMTAGSEGMNEFLKTYSSAL